MTRDLDIAQKPIRRRTRTIPAGQTAAVAAVGVVFVLFFVWPVVGIALRSLDPQGLQRLGSPTLEHYAALVTDPLLRSIAIRTVVISAAATALTLSLAFPTAYFIAHLGRRAATLCLLLVFLPFWASILVRTFSFVVILGREGPVNDLLRALGLDERSLLFNQVTVLIGMTNYLVPFMILILYAGMNRIDPQLTQASRSLGASDWQTFRRITFSLLRPTIVSGSVLIFVIALGFFLTPAVLGGPRSQTIAVYIQEQIGFFAWGTASAAGICLLVLAIVGYVVALRLTGTSVLVASSAGTRGAARSMALGNSVRSWLLGAVAALTIAFLLLPLLATLATSVGRSQVVEFPPSGVTLDWYREVVTGFEWRDAIARSVRVGACVAVITTVLGLGFVRWLLAVRSATARTLLEALALSPLVVPIIVLAIGMYDVSLRLGSDGTEWGLVPMHVVLAFPFVTVILKNALAGLDQSLEQAAWTLGASRLRTFLTVVLPAVWPSVIGAGLVSFLVSWDEVVIALFQTGFDKTLPVLVFAYLQSGADPTIFAAGGVIIFVLLSLLGLTAGSHRAAGLMTTYRESTDHA